MARLTRRAAILSAAGGAAVAAAPALAATPPAKPSAKAAVSRWPAAPGDMSLGDPQAPIHVVEYLSLACPHCAHFHADVFPAFKAKYIDTGLVYFTLRELLTAPAQVAAAGFLMARCKGDATTYFRIVDQVFRSQSRWQQGNIKPLFVEIAKGNGMTEAQFEACLEDEKGNAALEGRLKYAVETDKVTGTPTFFVNGTMLNNQEVPSLADLDAAIAKAGKGKR
ncbi:DsbA family protein [Phenylobacterium sp.]|uniref:DsbA family protein n=1 Tax=Phenylobacterium sp. TaxID=1871053 RepID=UPI0025D519D5|nr:DsbA family protein [Phenylobacterium sp.]MBX3485842.1 DsbA family protein [Phenylobacterium sp.]MCW5760918.1 DsbA family protein [Phenylobacterium sp.]